MRTSIYQSEIMLNMNSRLFINALDGVTDAQANDRISDHNNPLIWMATHTVWARFNICAMLGKPAANPYDGKFENFKAYNPNDTYATIANVKEE